MSQSEQVAINVEAARTLRAAAVPYREIGRRLGLTPAQLGLVKRTLKREKAGRTRLRNRDPGAGDRDLTLGHSALPKGLRHMLVKAGYRTLGDLADRLNDADRPPLETMPGIGPHRVRLVRGLLDQYGLLEGASDLQLEIERLFPDLAGEANSS